MTPQPPSERETPTAPPAAADADGSPRGVFAATLTPLDDELAPDHALLVAHHKWLLRTGCDGLAVLGTTGEANSFTVEERIGILECLAEAGVPGEAIIAGTGCCAVADTVRLTRRAIELGAAGVLMLPPFYYKNVSDDGLFAAYAEVIERVGDDRLRIYLYHFPAMSGVPLGPALIERLLEAYPGTVVGIKDSSGDWNNMAAMCRDFPGFSVFSGSEEFLLPILRAGGAGCISATTNVTAPLAARLYGAWRSPEAESLQAELTAVRRVFHAYPFTAGVKEVMGRLTGRASWRNVRPPLVRLTPEEGEALLAGLDAAGYSRLAADAPGETAK